MKKSPGYLYSQDELNIKINRLIGQTNAVRKMIQEKRNCPEILVQVASARALLDEIAIKLFEDHTTNCLFNDVKKGNIKSAKKELSNLIRSIQKV